MKATFDVTLISRADTVNLSNMSAISEQILEPGVNTSADIEEIVSQNKNEQWKISRFETTPPMSTYLVAFANGYFEHLETSVVMPLSKKTIPLRIYGVSSFFSCLEAFVLVLKPRVIATTDNIHQAQFALDVKAAVLPLYEKIFDVEYPLPKLDTLVVRVFYNSSFHISYAFHSSRPATLMQVLWKTGA